MFANVLNHDTLEAIVVHRVAVRLENRDLPSDLIRQTYMDVVSQDASIGEAFRADAMAVFDRDPACTRLIEPFLYFKGFHALQAYRLAHALWKAGRRDFALYLQSRASEVFQVDINPAALIGKGIFLDHACPRDGSGRGGQPPSNRRSKGRAAGSPRRRSWSRSADAGRPAR